MTQIGDSKTVCSKDPLLLGYGAALQAAVCLVRPLYIPGGLNASVYWPGSYHASLKFIF